MAKKTEWIRMTEYARKYSVTASAIYSAVDAGRLRDNGKRGPERRVDGSVDIRQNAATRDEMALRLANARVAKLEGEARLLEQRDERMKRVMVNDLADGFLQAFEEAFSPFRAELVRLRLTESQLADLHSAFDDGLSRMDKILERVIDENFNKA